MTLQADQPGDTLDPAFTDYLIAGLAGALPPAKDEEAGRARREAIRVAFLSMRPRNPTEAMLAAEAIGAHHVIMDCFRVALLPETDPTAAARARSNAATLSRVRLANLRALEKPPAPATVPPKPSAKRISDAGRQVDIPIPEEAAQEQIPTQERTYFPRDRFGNPIPLWRWQDMTMAQRRATYAEPRNVVALQEEALAEEAAMIAAQAAADANEPDLAADLRVTPQPAAPC
ncbi:MAG TPA: hypothetical protein VNW90_23210 [Acetobacteraceae bacterium]|jgi:hypothetical protein|nr:hypothetical protein [Acetobacteraceae bacterium]